jgi:nucleotide-binding universal stress UspA family protein
MSAASIITRGDQVRPEFEFQRILVLSDFSPGAKSALKCARAIARKFHSKILLLHVIPSGVFQLMSQDSGANALQRAKEFAEREIQVLLEEGKSSGIVEEALVLEGQLWPIISETIRSHQIDLIAMGTHSGTSEKKLVLGSVAERIYRMADCPILTSPPEYSSRDDIGIQRILIATDFKPHTERAAFVAHSLGCGPHEKLTLLHVVEEPSESSVQSNKIVREFLEKRMAKSMPAPCTGHCAPEYEVRFGKPADEILSASVEMDSDLIFIGARVKQRAAGHLPSALAYSIVCRATCPVLTIHQK